MDVGRDAVQTMKTTQPAEISVDQFIAGLREIASELVTKRALLEYLDRFTIARDDLAAYIHWSREHQTRNLIFRNDIAELLLICWEPGQNTPIHTHNGQLGWMTVIEGRLAVESFHVRSCASPENQEVVGIDCLAGASTVDLDYDERRIVEASTPAVTVDKHRTTHRIVNVAEWQTRAISLHLYSRPIDSCVVFDLDANVCRRTDLSYDYVGPVAS